MLAFLERIILSTKFWSVVMLVVGTIIFYKAIDYSLKNYINKKKKRATLAQKKRFTILTLCCSCLKYILALMDIVMILGVFGIKVTAFLAGLGIIAVVVGLALQDLLKDFIAGLFIILDDQYNVGDTVEIDGFRGDVVAVGLKSTKIKNYEGDIRIYSNKNISDIVNYSKHLSKAIVDFTFSSDINLKDLEKVIDKVVKVCNQKVDDLVGEVHYKGIQEYKDGKITLRINADVRALQQFSAESTIMHEAKLIFDQEGIKIK